MRRLSFVVPLLLVFACGKKQKGGLNWKEQALLQAIAAGDVAAVDKVVQRGLPINNPITIDSPQGVQHLTPLMLAAKAGQDALVQRLVALGSDIRLKDDQGWTALFWALSSKREDRGVAILQFLLDTGLPIDGTSKNGWTPLMVAAASNNLPAVQYLLSRGANVNTQEPIGGACALTAAIRVGNVSAVKLLVDAKADVNMKLPLGGFPLTLTTRGTVPSPADTEIAYYLLQHGANPNAIGEDGSTALSSALLESKGELAKLLLQYHADPNLAERLQGRNPLMICVLTRNYDMARLLMSFKADPFAQRASDKATALTLAQEQNDPQMFAILAGRGG